MTDLDDRLRELSRAMVADAPAPMAFERIAAIRLEDSRNRRSPHRLVVSLVAAVCLAAVTGIGVWVVRHGGSSTEPDPSAAAAADADGCFEDPGYFTNENGDTFGPMVPPDYEGTVTREMLLQAPDYTAFGCRTDTSGRLAGWIKRDDILRAQDIGTGVESFTVYDRDGVTVLGVWYLNAGPGTAPCGFVRTGQDLAKAFCPTGTTETRVGLPPHT